MIETKYQKIDVITVKDEACLRIEDEDVMLNLCWMNEEQVGKLIKALLDSKRRLFEYRQKMDEIMSNTNFTKLYSEFENRYNKYPVQMSRCEAFGRALNDGLIDRDIYDAAQKYYKNLWNYVGD